MDIYVLNSDATKVETIITPQECFEAIEEVEINNAGQLSVKLPVKYYQLIDDLDVMAIHAGGDRFRLYVIISRELQGDILSLTGIGYPNYYLSRVGYIKDIRPKKEPLQSLVTRILDGTPWEVGKVSETLPTYTGSFYYQSRLECLSEISQATACEFDFYVAISGNQITKQRVDILSKLGKNNGTWFEYGSNTLEVVAEYDATEVYTQAIGRGKGEEVGDGYGRRIEFTDVEWKKSQGYPVDKPLGKNFVNDPTTAYRLPGNKRLLKIIEFDEIEDPWELLQATYDWLIDNNRPKVQFRTTVADGHTLGLGDIVRVVRPDIGVRYETRVFKLTRNLLHPSLSSVEFGEKIASTPMDKINSMTHQIGQVAGSVDRIEQQVSQINVDGSTITYGPNEPTKKAQGDMWYKMVDGEVVGLLMWDGQQWVTVVDPTLEEKINAEIERLNKETTSAKENADQARKDAEKAAEDALNASNSASQTMSDLNKFKDESNTKFTEIKGSIDGLNTSVTNIDKDVQSKYTQLSDQITTEISSVNKKVDKNSTAIVQNQNDIILNSKKISILYPDGQFEESDPQKNYELSDGNTWDGISITDLEGTRNLYIKTGDTIIKKGVRTKEYIEIDPTKSVRLIFRSRAYYGTDDQLKVFVYIEEYNQNKSLISSHQNQIKYDRPLVWKNNTIEIKPEMSTQYIRITYKLESTSAKNVEIRIADVWLQNGTDSLNGLLAVNNSNINLSVRKNDVINQINLSTEGILIDGNKTHITGQTKIDNAVITSAMIKDVNAGKITTGTLNANNVKIINLDVNTLTGNKAQFIQAAFKDANSSTTINAQGIITKNSHMTTALNAGRLEFRDKGGHLTGSIETSDQLLYNGYDDTLVFKILGRRQLQIMFTDDDDKDLTPAFSIKQRPLDKTGEMANIIKMEDFHNALSTSDDKLLAFNTDYMLGASNKLAEVVCFRYQSTSESWADPSGRIGFSKSHLWLADEWNNVTLDDLCNGWLKSMHTPGGYPIKIVDSTINNNKAFAFRSSEGGNAVVINNANVKIYAKYDLIFGDGYGSQLTLNQIRKGIGKSFGFEDGTEWTKDVQEINGEPVHMLVDNEGAGIAMKNGSLLFKDKQLASTYGLEDDSWFSMSDIIQAIIN